MKFYSFIATISLVFFSISTFAQAVALDPTGKRYMKPRERTKFGGPTHQTHKMPLGDESINVTFVEIQIDPAAKGVGIDVTVRGTKTPKVRGCDYCPVAGRVIINGDATKEIESAADDASTKEKQTKNTGAARVVTFKNALNKEFSVVTSPEGGFMLNTLPNGTYTIWVGGRKVISDFILKTIEPSPEQLKKEEELRKAAEQAKPVEGGGNVK